MDKLTKVYLIECRTGCSCCSNENHLRGIYLTKEEAEARIKRFRQGVDNPVASQYSRFGNYSIEEEEGEEISGDRIIVGGRKVHSKDDIVTVNLVDGSVDANDFLEYTGY